MTTNRKIPRLVPGGDLTNYPPPELWDDWAEWDAKAWPKRKENRYRLVPTTCFNCESACGLLAYVDKDTGEIRRFEGNPEHPGSRGRNCAKGPATINQVNDPERILYPLRRKGARGSGEWERVTWEEVLVDIGGRIGKAIREDRKDEIMYHVGRPGEDGFMERTLKAWGVDGHNSHTNICSSGARVGYAMWSGYDRPSATSPTRSSFFCSLRIWKPGTTSIPMPNASWKPRGPGRNLPPSTRGCRTPRRCPTTGYQHGPAPKPGSFSPSPSCCSTGRNRPRVCQTMGELGAIHEKEVPRSEPTYTAFIEALKETYVEYTPEWAADEGGINADQVVAVAKEIANAGHRFSSHTWRATGSGNLGGWQAARTLQFLHVLTGSVGTKGGLSPAGWGKFKPEHWKMPPPHSEWNELLWPIEYPLAHHELSFLLPHLINQGRGKLDVYFTRVYNPIWTNPDGFSWLEMLTDEDKVGLHIALTPTWSETAFYADYVLPMGVAAERHDTHSYETHAGQWLGFRQPVLRVAGEREGKTFRPHLRSEPRRSVGGNGVLDRPLVAYRPRWFTGHTGIFRITKRSDEASQRRRVLRVDVREQRARAPRGG